MPVHTRGYLTWNRRLPNTHKPYVILGNPALDALRNLSFKKIPDRIRHAQHKRVKTRGYERHPDHDLIHGTLRISCGGDVEQRHHERKFPDLRQTE